MKNFFGLLFLVSHLIFLVTSFSSFPMGSNASTSQLQVRQPIYPTMHCGDKIKIRRENSPNGRTRICTLGFAVKKMRGRGPGKFDHGYLTLGDCVPSLPLKSRGGGDPHDVMYGAQDLIIGKAYNNRANLKYDPVNGLDYTIIKITELRV